MQKWKLCDDKNRFDCDTLQNYNVQILFASQLLSYFKGFHLFWSLRFYLVNLMDVFIATDKGVCALVAWSLILCTGIRNLISNIRECMFRWSRLRESVYQLNIIHLCCITNMFNFWEQENHWNWRHPSPVLKPSAINFPIESTIFFSFTFFIQKRYSEVENAFQRFYWVWTIMWVETMALPFQCLASVVWNHFG